MKSYSNDLRTRVIQDVEAERKICETAAKWKVGMRTISYWVKRFRETGSSHPPKKELPGPRRKLLPHLDLVRKLVEEQPDITLKEIQSKLPVRVCLQTISAELKKMNFTVFEKNSRGRATKAGCDASAQGVEKRVGQG